MRLLHGKTDLLDIHTKAIGPGEHLNFVNDVMTTEVYSQPRESLVSSVGQV